jgi:hypothetical protein
VVPGGARGQELKQPPGVPVKCWPLQQAQPVQPSNALAHEPEGVCARQGLQMDDAWMLDHNWCSIRLVPTKRHRILDQHHWQVVDGFAEALA